MSILKVLAMLETDRALNSPDRMDFHSLGPGVNTYPGANIKKNEQR